MLYVGQFLAVAPKITVFPPFWMRLSPEIITVTYVFIKSKYVVPSEVITQSVGSATQQYRVRPTQ
jgi:hypothetical protein